QLPFPDAAFDALTFTYLLRYVEDPAAVLEELARVVRPGGTIAGLEFAVPRGIWRPLWELYVRVGLPGAGRAVSPGLGEGGSFLGAEQRRFMRELPGGALAGVWVGCRHPGRARPPAEPGGRHREGGPARVSATPRPAFSALARGGGRDYVPLLPPPYTAWH